MHQFASAHAQDQPLVALLLPDGVGLRNFLVGTFRSEAAGRLSLMVVDRVPDDMRQLYDGASRDVAATDAISWHPYLSYRDSLTTFLLRNTVSYAHMYSVKTFGMRCFRELPVGGSMPRRLATHAARYMGRGVAAVRQVRRLDARLGSTVERVPETAHYERLFAQTRPEVVLSSNQRPASVLPMVLAARRLGIPTATCIFSWDNLTSKGRIAAPFDHYFVWSELMKRELHAVYPEIPRDRSHIVGAPQFDAHVRTPLMSREAFCAALGADPARPMICYSSGDAGCTPEDQDHLELLLRLIREGRIAGRPQVVLRPTPTTDGRRFAGVRERCPELICSPPAWTSPAGGDWTQVLPRPEDPALLANLAHHSDVNVSVASTMTLDFAIHNRPVVNIAFDIASPPPFPLPLWEYYYRFEHYQPVIRHEAALFARSADELVTHVNTYLANPHLHEANRRRLLSEELGVPPGEASRCLVEALRRIAGRHSGTSAAAVPAPAIAAAG